MVDKCQVLYIGYPKADVGQKFKDVRDNSSEPDWMVEISDQEVKDYIERFKGTSQYFQNHCDQRKIEFVDLSQEFERRIDCIIERIKGEQERLESNQ